MAGVPIPSGYMICRPIDHPEAQIFILILSSADCHPLSYISSFTQVLAFLFIHFVLIQFISLVVSFIMLYKIFHAFSYIALSEF